jgi:hypothetical protein
MVKLRRGKYGETAMANPLTTDGLDCIARKEFIAAQLLNLPDRDLLALYEMLAMDSRVRKRVSEMCS